MSGREPNETAAHRYADVSWPVVPLIPGEKAPITRHGFQDAGADHRQIQKWYRDFPDRNVGIATGTPGPDVLDVDQHPDGSGLAPTTGCGHKASCPTPPRPSAAARRVAPIRRERGRSGSLAGRHMTTAPGGANRRTPWIDLGRRRAAQALPVVSRGRGGATFDWDAARRLLPPERPRQQPEHPARHPSQVDHLPDWAAQRQDGIRVGGLFWACKPGHRPRPPRGPRLPRPRRQIGRLEPARDPTDLAVRAANRSAGSRVSPS